MNDDWSAGPFGQDVAFGYVDKSLAAPHKLHPELILNTEHSSMLRTLREELQRCTSFTFSVAFVSPRAIALLKQELIDFVGVGRIITSDYLGFNSPSAFRELENLKSLGIDVRLHRETAFHPKGYVFQRGRDLTVVMGSSNLTENALARNLEWNLKVSAAADSDLAEQFSNLLDQQLFDSDPLTPEWIADYEKSYVPAPTRLERVQPNAPTVLVPNSMQVEALARIREVRESGERKSIVVSATGTGKTILSAMDVRQADPSRVLFLAHREQILDRAMYEFQRVLGLDASKFGKVTGGARQGDRKYVFATVQTMSQRQILESFARDAFDYVLIDEVHRAGAASYLRVMEYFEPRFLLGMTATPERPDGFNLFEMFDYNVPFEIRLQQALELDMLAPFHYYGVTDLTFEDGTTTTDATPLAKLVEPVRVDYILETIRRYGQAGVAPRGLIFCSRKEEARALSDELNIRQLRGRALRTVALTGEDSIEHREHVVDQLEAGELDYVLTVDIFNEGVDIPSVNQVVMLRQTQSSIVFVQQLGRGLRKAPEKEYVVVIDFIGNYANNYLIPIALFGDDSLNRESIRKNLIAAEEAGVLAGLSSVRFDRVSQQRVLKAVADAKLDSLPNLKRAIESVRNRIGRVPDLEDFVRFESADPFILATKAGSYPQLLAKLKIADSSLDPAALKVLNIWSREILTAKRPDELTILSGLLSKDRLTRSDIADLLSTAGIDTSDAAIDSDIRSLTLEFNTETERGTYGRPPVESTVNGVQLTQEVSSWLRSSEEFRHAAVDLVRTGLEVTASRYGGPGPFTLGRQYGRKDASRLLRLGSNRAGTIFGYAVDAVTSTCPIFVTLHKSDDVSSSTAYEDELLDTTTMLWFTKSKRTLQSADVTAILGGSVALHVFAKKDDAEGADFYYLGEAKALDPLQTTMKSGESVVQMHLRFNEPIEQGLFDYFEPTTTAFT